MLAQIFERLHSHGSCIIHFAYYASLIFQKVGTIDENTHYTGALQNADYILPDGVALRLLVRRLLSLELHNLNGTDFVPQLLDALRSREEVRVFLYGGTPEVVEKMRVLVEGFYELPVVWAMDGYGDEVDPLKFSVFAGPGINLLLVAR